MNIKTLKVIPAEDRQTLNLCLKMRNCVFIEEMGVPASVEMDEKDVPDGICDHFLLEFGGEPVGTLRCEKNGKTVKVQRFCILKEYRHSGLGRKTLEMVETFFRDRNFSECQLNSKYGVFGFYEKCGYEVASDVFEEAGIPHVKMIKKL